MNRYVLDPKEGKSVKVYGRGLRVSSKKSGEICRAITGMSLENGKEFVEGLLSRKTSINGKYHDNPAAEILGLLKSAEANAEFKGLPPERMFIHASAHQGASFYTPRRLQMRGRKRKVSHIQLVLQQR